MSDGDQPADLPLPENDHQGDTMPDTPPAERAMAEPLIIDRPEPRRFLVPDPHGSDYVTVTADPHSQAPGVFLNAWGANGLLIGDEPVRVAVALIDAWREANDPPVVVPAGRATTDGVVYDPDNDNCAGGCRRNDNRRVVFAWYQDKHFACPGCFEELFGAPPHASQPVIAVPVVVAGGGGTENGDHDGTDEAEVEETQSEQTGQASSDDTEGDSDSE